MIEYMEAQTSQRIVHLEQADVKILERLLTQYKNRYYTTKDYVAAKYTIEKINQAIKDKVTQEVDKDDEEDANKEDFQETERRAKGILKIEEGLALFKSAI